MRSQVKKVWKLATQQADEGYRLYRLKTLQVLCYYTLYTSQLHKLKRISHRTSEIQINTGSKRSDNLHVYTYQYIFDYRMAKHSSFFFRFLSKKSQWPLAVFIAVKRIYSSPAAVQIQADPIRWTNTDIPLIPSTAQHLQTLPIICLYGPHYFSEY